MCVTRIEHTVKSYDCQADSKINYSSLMQILQESAHVSANNLGFGYDSLKETGRVWVLSNFKIVFETLPLWNEKISVLTWPGTFNRLLATREFVVKDAQEKNIAAATSEWFTLDVKSRKLIGLEEVGKKLISREEKALGEKLKRLNPKKFPEGQKIDEITVPYSATDLNEHVNNAEYIRWTFDALRKNDISSNSVKSFQITYISESFENDKIEFYLAYSPDNKMLVHGVNSQSGEFIYAMEIELTA